MEGDCTRVMLITANVGSIFEEVKKELWLALVQCHNNAYGYGGLCYLLTPNFLELSGWLALLEIAYLGIP